MSHAAILEGFTIINGSASNGGGVNILDSSNLVISRCIIKNNNADSRGGGIYIGSSTAKIENCIITNNSATEGHGIYTYKTTCELLNTTITQNSFPAGEGFKGYRSTAIIKNVILWHNGDEIILENNTTANVEFCNVEGGYEGQSNINLDPLFVNSENENFHIRMNSPCKDSGILLHGIYNDIDNQLRPIGTAYDIGADEAKEYTNPTLSLIALYNSTDGENWNNNTNWLGVSGTECTWFGVNCEDGNIVRLNLSNNQLNGTIPAELGQLSSLQSLILSNNQLTGSLSAELGQLSNLQSLVLSRNQLAGNIPSELAQLSNLQSLLLNDNQLTGSIPPELSQLSHLEYLYLYANKLTGSIPSQLGQIENLQDLNLSSNKLSGNIPSELGQLTNLQNLDLSFNELTGSLPEELGLLSNLKYLVLESNLLTEEIPSELGQLSILQSLALSSNQLTGEIPKELGRLSNLRQLLIDDNKLTGLIPNEIGQLSNLLSLHLDRNALFGNIPSDMGQLSKLNKLSLYENQFTGNIPSELGQLANLRILRLESNELSGIIPSELMNLVNLVENECNYYYGYNDFRWNSLYTLNTELIAFLNKKQCGGDWQSFQTDITPIASFSATPINGTEPLTVQLTDTSTSGTNIVKWLWKFGDYSTSTEQNPSYVYDQQGEYTVTLSIEDNKGNISHATPLTIVVDDVDPVANFTANPQLGYEYMSVSFSNLSTSHDEIISLLWDFGDGYTSTEYHPQHIYKKEGNYSVSLTVFEQDNDTDDEIKQDLISVSVRPPISVCNYGCEYNLIQSAIDNNTSGTTIQVQPGKYIGQIDFQGKAITIEATGPVNETILDARHMGGAVKFVNGETNTSVLKGLTIKNGAAEKGGGIFIDNASPEITSCNIIKNSAETSGAGIYMTNNAAPIIKDCSITNNNVANDGGGIYCDKASQLKMETCIISKNNSARGGGIYADASILDFHEMLIQNNTAMQSGGGLLISNNASLTMTNSQVSANASMGSGGGIVGVSDTTIVIINCLLNGNTAGYDGGAFYLENSFLKLLNSTLTMNMAKYGRGIFADGSTVIITNSILWNNGQEIENFGSSITGTYSNIQQESDVFPGEGNINVNPEFREADDYRLENDSPCIGLGTDIGAPVEDIQGITRPSDGTVTMGAYEVNNTRPSASFQVNEQSIYSGNSVQFYDGSISQEGIYAWYWEFGDGTTSSQKNPSHTYAYTGLYDVTLTVMEEDEDSSTIEKRLLLKSKAMHRLPFFQQPHELALNL
ncbi:MAG: hypothetical protein OMM_00802 [Candidatus Magnetoglobus multicellularis str. Araruama]|uniref:non-specific serine/threonine protein kinase n=1 Tax=Candidatus Magnetoglobus multicellularis str. Araruama TaxID=890399 RepID=A0A1V1PG31_9BACT|nr:MAG: hypothetical protein OMM_00802 [Candidatus Magnetoglobus multicellularis str. Araruama]